MANTERLSEQLEIIVGGMFSGKTTELLRRLRRHTAARRKVLLVKPRLDIRYGQDMVANHDGMGMAAGLVVRLAELKDTLPGVDVLCVDEAQFIVNLAADVIEIVDQHPRLKVILAGLSGTSDRKRFGEIWDLAPMASQIDLLHSVCHYCLYERASYSVCVVPKPNGDTLIGGAAEYKSACEACWRKQQQHQ